MARLSFVVLEEYEGYRVDSFLRSYGLVTGSTLRKAKQVPLGITQDGEHIRTVDFVRVGSVIEIEIVESKPEYDKSEEKVDIIFENDDFVIFNKPANMPMHPSRGTPYGTLLNVFASNESTKDLTFRALNRLDKDTSGLCFVAKNSHIASLYHSKITKHYLAIVEGELENEVGIIDEPIRRLEEGSIIRTVAEDGKRAVTEYKVLRVFEGKSLIMLRLETGRTHQIRVHMSHIGHPLIGDSLYGGNMSEMKRQALHCFLGSFDDVTVIAMPPDDFLEVIGGEFDPLPFLEEE